MVICFGWFIASSVSAMFNGFPVDRSFSDGNLGALLLMECLLGTAALWYLHGRGYSLASLLPSPTVQGSFLGAGLAIAAMMAWWAVSQLFSRDLLESQPVVQMAARAHPSLIYVIAISMVNGLYEETFLTGYLVRVFSASGATFAVGLSLLVRVLYHLYQGPVGAVSVLVFGLVVSAFYWRTRVLWPVVFAHTLVDVVALH